MALSVRKSWVQSVLEPHILKSPEWRYTLRVSELGMWGSLVCQPSYLVSAWLRRF